MTKNKNIDDAVQSEPRFNNGRMYVSDRNISLVGLRDLPHEMMTGTSAAQLTPIYSILHEVIQKAFAAQVRGEVESYMDLIELKPKYKASKLEVRTDANPDSFGWIDNLELLKKLPYEYTPLVNELDKRFNEFKQDYLLKVANGLLVNIKLANKLNTMDSIRPQIKDILSK